jgi:hypothetical protein
MELQIVTYKGIVKGNTVILEAGAELPDGAEVIITPMKGTPAAVLAALDASPCLEPGDVEELLRRIEEGKQLARYEDPFAHPES